MPTAFVCATASLGEQPRRRRSTTLLVWTKGSRLGTGLPRPARDCSVSSLTEAAPSFAECGEGAMS
jgi:hypothetical protein